MNRTNKKTVAIIGCGPRGLHALENLCLAYSKSSKNFNLKIIVFERTGLFGSGQVYAPHQNLCNWMNISERSLTISERKPIRVGELLLEGFPSYHDWASYTSTEAIHTDVFPTRGYVGTYLEERFKSIANTLMAHTILELHQELVTALDYNDTQFKLSTKSGLHLNADEVLLTVGHQPTYTSQQIKKWKTFSNTVEEAQLIENPYPIERLLSKLQTSSSKNVAIRGFGLAAIDIIRAIAVATNSKFEIIDEATQSMVFHPGNTFPKKIMPFSLDGLPMHPKPLNKQIDDYFTPSSNDLKHIETTISNTLKNPENVTSMDFLIETMAQLIAKQFLLIKDKTVSHNLSEYQIKQLVILWINGEAEDNPLFTSDKLTADDSLQLYINMASGVSAIRLDYCIGQVWRHCHPTLYKILSYSNLNSEVVLEMITLDERLKRLTFGPPLASLQQMLAILKSGRMTVKVIDDPDIECTDSGWTLEEGNDEFTASIMINSVLDASKILEVDTPLIKTLLQKGFVLPIHDNLGIATCENGLAKTNAIDRQIPIALLGRLAQGTLVGVDAILECFGNRSQVWAKAAIERLNA